MSTLHRQISTQTSWARWSVVRNRGKMAGRQSEDHITQKPLRDHGADLNWRGLCAQDAPGRWQTHHRSKSSTRAASYQRPDPKTAIGKFQIGGCVPSASGASRRSAAAARGSGAPPNTPAGSGAKSLATARRGKAASGRPGMAATGWARPEIAATRTCPARHACRKHRSPTIRESEARTKCLCRLFV